MKRHIFLYAILSILVVMGTFTTDASAQKKQETEQIEPDSGAVAVINTLLQALSLDDESARWGTLVRVLHPVMLTKDGADVHPNFKRILQRKIKVIETYPQPAEFEKVERVRVVSGNKHRFGALEIDVVDRYYLKSTTGKSSFVTIVWTEEHDGPKIVVFL